MRILITGGAGFIGSHLIEQALQAGHEVETIDALTYAGCRDNLPAGFRGLHVGDIADRELMRHHMARFRPDWVIHAAAETHVGRAVNASEVFLQTNVIGTHVLLEAALEYWRERSMFDAFRFLHVSTDEVHGSIERGEWTEDSPYQPNNQYAASKAGADHLCRAYWQTQRLPVIVTHCGNNYGARQHGEKLLPTLIRQALRHEPFTLHGDGLNVRDWIAVEDHCWGILAALQVGEPGEVYAFSAGEQLTNLQVARMVASAAQLADPRIDFIADRPGNDRRYAMNCRHTRQMLGWWPQTNTILSGLSRMIDWYTKNQRRRYGSGAMRNWG